MVVFDINGLIDVWLTDFEANRSSQHEDCKAARKPRTPSSSLCSWLKIALIKIGRCMCVISGYCLILVLPVSTCFKSRGEEQRNIVLCDEITAYMSFGINVRHWSRDASMAVLLLLSAY